MNQELELTLLKFADGELTPEEESCFLAECEVSPQQWKQLALAMVAQRRLTEALAGFEESATPRNLKARSAETNGSAGISTAKSRWYMTARLTVISMAMVLAFFIGKQQVQSTAPLVVEVEPSPLLLNDQSEAQKAQVAASGVPELDEFPYDRQEVVNPWTVVSKPVLSEADRHAFSDAGLDVQEENTIYIVNDADGGRWAIPWKYVNVRY